MSAYTRKSLLRQFSFFVATFPFWPIVSGLLGNMIDSREQMIPINGDECLLWQFD